MIAPEMPSEPGTTSTSRIDIVQFRRHFRCSHADHQRPTVHGFRLSVPTCVRTGKSVGFQEQHPCPRSHQRQHRSGTRSSAAQLSDSSTRPSSHTCLPDLFQRQPPAQAARLGQLITLVHAGGIDRHLVGWPRAAAGVEPVRCIPPTGRQHCYVA